MRSNSAPRTHTNHQVPPFLLWCNGLLREGSWWVSRRGSLDGMQGVRGSNPLSSTPGQRPSPPSTARELPASGSKSAAICLCEADLVVRHAVDAGPASSVSSTGGPIPTGPPLPARSCATKAGSTAHTFDITGSSGSGPGMEGRDWQVLLRGPTSLWASGFQPGEARSGPSEMVRRSRIVPDQQGGGGLGHPRRSGAVRLGADWLGRTPQNRPALLRPWPHRLRARVLDLKLVILLPWR